MSEIPFVNQLGDAVEAAIARPEAGRSRPPRRRRRRIAVMAFAIFALGATGTTIAALVSGQDERALGNIGCYERADLRGPVDHLVADGVSPVEACARHRSDSGLEPTPLVACRPRGDGVAVVPGRGAATCRALGLRALPAALTAAQPKVERLARDIASIEEDAECISPPELRDRAQALLDHPGWEGWRARIEPGDGGPCGWIRQPGGGSEGLSLHSALHPNFGELHVVKGPPRSLYRLLFGEAGADGLNARLMEASGRHCFTEAQLRAHARRTLKVTRLPVTFRALGPLPPNTGMTPASRQEHYEEGCAIGIDARPVYPEPDAITLVVEYYLKRR